MTRGDGVSVLQVVTSATARGAETYAVGLEQQLIDRGLDVRTVALHPGHNPSLDVSVLGSSPLGRATLAELRDRSRAVDVVVAHGSVTLPATALATAALPVPFVYRNIGDPAYWASTWRRRWQTRLLLGRARSVVGLTELARDRMVDIYRYPADRIDVIPNGVPSASFPLRTNAVRHQARRTLGIEPASRVALCLGALSPEKRVAAAITAVQPLPDWQLVVAGDGPERDELERRAAHLDGRVRFLGHVDDPLTVLQAADVLVLPSRTEGLPGVIIEAALVGVPTVATDVGFVRDLIDDGQTGVVVPADAVDSLADALRAVADLAPAMGAKASVRARERFTLEVTADAWAEVLGRFGGDGPTDPVTSVGTGGQDADAPAGGEVEAAPVDGGGGR